MTITRKEIKDDFYRFIRHEAMRANTSQDVIKRLIFDKYLLPISRQQWEGVTFIDIYTGPLENTKTTITKEQISDDVARFVRHEAMRANTLQHEIRMIILVHVYLYWLIDPEDFE